MLIGFTWALVSASIRVLSRSAMMPLMKKIKMKRIRRVQRRKKMVIATKRNLMKRLKILDKMNHLCICSKLRKI